MIFSRLGLLCRRGALHQSHRFEILPECRGDTRLGGSQVALHFVKALAAGDYRKYRGMAKRELESGIN